MVVSAHPPSASKPRDLERLIIRLLKWRWLRHGTPPFGVPVGLDPEARRSIPDAAKRPGGMTECRTMGVAAAWETGKAPASGVGAPNPSSGPSPPMPSSPGSTASLHLLNESVH